MIQRGGSLQKGFRNLTGNYLAGTFQLLSANRPRKGQKGRSANLSRNL